MEGVKIMMGGGIDKSVGYESVLWMMWVIRWFLKHSMEYNASLPSPWIIFGTFP